jgi:hypothetical protein
MVKYGYKKTAECTLCKKAHEESGSSWNRELPKETIGHIQSARCLGQKEVVIAAHNACIRELLQEVDGHGKADRHMKLLTIETESSLSKLSDQEQCTQFCSKEELWEAAKEEEMKIPWKDEKEGRFGRPISFPTSLCGLRVDDFIECHTQFSLYPDVETISQGQQFPLTIHPPASYGSSVILLEEGSTWLEVDERALYMPLHAVP